MCVLLLLKQRGLPCRGGTGHPLGSHQTNHMNAPVPYFHWKPPDNTICASTRYYCVAPSLSLMSEFVGGENDQRMVIVRKMIFLCRELGERIKRLNVFISTTATLAWIMHHLDVPCTTHHQLLILRISFALPKLSTPATFLFSRLHFREP